MKGLSLNTFQLDLHKVESDSQSPIKKIYDFKAKLNSWAKKFEKEHGYKPYQTNRYYDLPLEAFAEFSSDELCKLQYSSRIMMDKTVRDLFDTDAQYTLVEKIENSIWKWSLSRGTWNEIVDAYNNIRNFSFSDKSGFELELDWTTGYNEFGYSKFSRTYIDGVFAFLVYYKSKHVMTIGFSILNDRRILIQQVQSAQRSGNRWLFKIPKNRIEFIIDLFLRNFPNYKLYLIDGACLVEKTLKDYRNALTRNQKWLDEFDSNNSKYLERLIEERIDLKFKVAHLESEKSRLANFYQETGRHLLTPDSYTKFGLPHFEIACQT